MNNLLSCREEVFKSRAAKDVKNRMDNKFRAIDKWRDNKLLSYLRKRAIRLTIIYIAALVVISSLLILGSKFLFN